MRSGVIGSGPWGLAISSLLSRNGEVILKTRKRRPVDNIPDSVLISENMSDLDNVDCLFLAIPAQLTRSFCTQIKSEVKNSDEKVIVICSKGIESDTSLLLSEVASEFFPLENLAVMSGPNFAQEIINGGFSAADMACNYNKFKLLQQKISSEYFSINHTDDIIGVQLCGAIKNVIAIATGFAIASKMNQNTLSLLFKIGLDDLEKLLKAYDAQTSTINGLSGIGDIMLTCFSLQSRNTKFGFDTFNNMNCVLSEKMPEGYYTVKALNNIKNRKNTKTVLFDYVYDVLYDNISMLNEKNLIAMIRKYYDHKN